nr:NLR family CARD domain-containing protein 3-like isoform X2 [Paramormyrops kingsleyae]
MKTDRSIDLPLNLKKADIPFYQRIQQDRPDSPIPSCLSMKSDKSIDLPLNLKEAEIPFDEREKQKGSDSMGLRMQFANRNEELSSILQLLEENAVEFLKDQLKQYKKYLSEDYPACCEAQMEDGSVMDGDNKIQKSYGSEGALKIMLYILRAMKQTDLADRLEHKETMDSQHKLKQTLQKRFQYVFEGQAKQGNAVLLNQIYTELYITEGGTGAVNDQHEVTQIETSCKRPTAQETVIKCNDIFKTQLGQKTQIRTVLTRGVAGIGKTVSVQKFILDWSQRRENQDIHFVFPLPFRDLNLMKEKEYSLIQLLHHFLPEIKELGPAQLSNCKVLFIFDGLDECRIPLNFLTNESWFDVAKPTSLDVLLTNLIKGNLLPSALLWITSRPAAVSQIPPECANRLTEIRGFNNPQKEEYFRKRFCDQDLASRIISHVRSSKSLYIMCYIPVFCWISATVLEKLLGKTGSGKIPKTLTQMYTHFVIFHTTLKNQKYLRKQTAEPLSESVRADEEFLLKLGMLAFRNLKNGNLIFYEKDLRECGIDMSEASIFSGMCTEMFREEIGLYQQKVYCFVHLSIQEYLAALYVFLTNVDQTFIFAKFSFRQRESTMSRILKDAVDESLQSKTGHLDLYLRFLLGLSMDSCQTLLQGILSEIRFQKINTKETANYIKEKIREDLPSERAINLFHCLNELNDNTLVEEVQSYLSSGSLSAEKLSPAQWSALTFVLLTSDGQLDVFDLKRYIGSDDGLLRLLPVVKASRTALLNSCNLTERSCEVLFLAVSSNSCALRELDLSENPLKDSGVNLLSVGMKNHQCKIKSFRLSACGITDTGCVSLASALRSNPSHLRELDLSDNNIGDSGVKLLSAVLKDPKCQLEKLSLSHCGITDTGCVCLASALKSNPSHLRELDLSYNHPGDSGVKLLSAVLEDPKCQLEKLRMLGCRVTDTGCASLASAIRSNPSHLRELDLSYNHTGDSGIKQRYEIHKDTTSHLKTLKLSDKLAEAAYAYLISAQMSHA